MRRIRANWGRYKAAAYGIGEDRALRRPVSALKGDDPPTNSTLADRWLDRLKNMRAVALAIVVGAIIVGVATVWNALPPFIQKEATHLFHSSPKLPGDTGWIFVGYYNAVTEAFIEGPKVEIVNSGTRARNFYVEIGDTVRLENPTKVYIVDFEPGKDPNKKLVSPITKGVLSAADETGITLAAGTELIVRDVSKGAWLGNPNAAIWARVVLEQDSSEPE